MQSAGIKIFGKRLTIKSFRLMNYEEECSEEYYNY